VRPHTTPPDRTDDAASALWLDTGMATATPSAFSPRVDRHRPQAGGHRARACRNPAGPPAPAALAAWLMRGPRWTRVRIGCDLTLLVLAAALGLVLTPGAAPGLELFAFPPLTLGLLHARGRYRHRLQESALDGVAPGVGAMSLGAMGVFMLTIATVGNSLTTSSLIAHTWIAAVVLLTLAGLLLAALETAARSRRWVATPTLIVGAGDVGKDAARRLAKHPECGLQVVGFVDPIRRRLAADGMPPILGSVDRLAEVAAAHGVGRVVIALPEASQAELIELLRRSQGLGLATTLIPRASGAINQRSQFEYLAGALPVLNMEPVDPASLGFSAKYLVDRLVAGVLLVLLAPLMVAIALAVRLSSPGPILFRQSRTGQDGRLFDLLKFRTMQAGPAAPAFVPGDGLAPGGVEGVDRRTRAGCLLRRTSLDELPQLLNVLGGSMSLIGPRPERPEFAEEFRRRFADYRDRDRVRSGITGWAQVNGSRGQTPIPERVELDNFYIDHWSPGLDAKILFRTVPALFKGS
jgi:exopolysaccharide biosynthesis polyprenyl glycosylphosphotransferase